MNGRKLMQRAICVAALAAGSVGLPSYAQTDPGRWVAAPEGTVSVYQRKSEGSYGVYEGQVKWTLGQRDWNGRMLVSSSSERHGIQLMDPVTHGLAVQLNSQGQPAYSFNPPVTWEWPLAVGKTWSSVHEMTQYQPPRVVSAGFQFKVEALEDVTVPAGTFKAFKLVTQSSFGEVEQTWVVPTQGLNPVKVIRDRPASHPLGAGHLEGVLVSRSLPPR